jgi:hypothetical protein
MVTANSYYNIIIAHICRCAVSYLWFKRWRQRRIALTSSCARVVQCRKFKNNRHSKAFPLFSFEQKLSRYVTPYPALGLKNVCTITHFVRSA